MDGLTSVCTHTAYPESGTSDIIVLSYVVG
jgi:hypothetical protein